MEKKKDGQNGEKRRGNEMVKRMEWRNGEKQTGNGMET